MLRGVRRFSPAIWLAAWMAAAAATSLPVGAYFGISDWVSFVVSGRAFERGLDPYAVPPSVARSLGRDIPRNYDRPNLNPPPTLLLFGPLSRAPARTTFHAVRVLGMLALALALYASRAFHNPIGLLVAAWVLVQPGTQTTLILGQIYGLLSLLLLAAWCLAERRHEGLAGAAIGALCTIKPNFLLLAAVLLFAQQWRIALAALATFAVANGAVLATAGGPSLYIAWFHAAAAQSSQWLIPGASLNTMLFAVGRPELFWPLGVALAAAAFVVCWVRKPPLGEAAWLGTALSTFVTPVGWVGYNLFLLPFVAPRASRPVVVCALLCFVPLWVDGFTPAQRVLLYSLGMLAMLAQAGHDAWHAAQPASWPLASSGLHPAPTAALVPRPWTARRRG